MKPSDTVTRVDGKARKLFQGPIRCLPPADPTPQLQGQKLKAKISIIAFCQIHMVRFSDAFFFKDMPCGM